MFRNHIFAKNIQIQIRIREKRRSSKTFGPDGQDGDPPYALLEAAAAHA
jgi:hypothetical protein